VAEVLDALASQQAELTGLLVDLDERGWARPSRCEGWSVSDVVLHLAQTNEMAIGSATGTYTEALTRLTAGLAPGGSGNVDDGADLMVAHERGTPPADVLARWRDGAATLLRVLSEIDPSARVTWVAGELSARTLTTTRLAETWIHTGDVAHGLGVELAPTDRLWHIARLAWRTLPYAFARVGRELSGPVRFDLVGPAGDAWRFEPDREAATSISGSAVELCLVAARRVEPQQTGLRGEGPDGERVLELVRTYA
jgi:uncharacterized protein (TIGR03084 family)